MAVKAYNSRKAEVVSSRWGSEEVARVATAAIAPAVGTTVAAPANEAAAAAQRIHEMTRAWTTSSTSSTTASAAARQAEEIHGMVRLWFTPDSPPVEPAAPLTKVNMFNFQV